MSKIYKYKDRDFILDDQSLECIRISLDNQPLYIVYREHIYEWTIRKMEHAPEPVVVTDAATLEEVVMRAAEYLLHSEMVRNDRKHNKAKEMEAKQILLDSLEDYDGDAVQE